MIAKLFVFFALVALSQAALVRRDAPTSTPLQDIEKYAAELQMKIREQSNALSNSKNTQEFNKSVKEVSDTMLKQLSSLSDHLKAALTDDKGNAKEALEEVRRILELTAGEERNAHPGVEQQATSLNDKLSTAVQSALQESQKIAKEIAANIEAYSQKLAYDDFVKQSEQMQKKIHEAAVKQ